MRKLKYVKLFENFKVNDNNHSDDINQLISKIENHLKSLDFEIIDQDRFDKIKHKVEKGAEEGKRLAGVGIVEYAEGNNIAVSIGMPPGDNYQNDTYTLENKIMDDIVNMTGNFERSWYRGKHSINCSISIR